ncbi:MAG TPA: prepilin-type N-terminal cleavage/methylation domain-containing protein [Methylomirabilota bacterium]|nr:prepilin-type N-terminal cleavage/methylation domain-containing protein [Methylomirabilota bacterium]
MKFRNARAAFTLIEILLAIGIFAMVMIAIYASWTAIIRGSQAALDAAAGVQRSRIAMQALEDAFLTTIMFNENGRHYQFIADTSGDFPYLSLVSRVPSSFPGGGMYGDLRLRRITFSVEASDDRQPVLVMRQIPLLWETNSVVEPYEIILARNVESFLLEFWDSQNEDWVEEWTASNSLPAMVRVALAVGGRTQSRTQGSPPQLTVRAVALPAQAVLPEWQNPQMVPTQPVPGRGVPPGQSNRAPVLNPGGPAGNPRIPQ